MSSLDGSDPTSTELLMSKVSSILMQPGRQMKGVIGITAGSGVEWILFLFNSAIWGFVVVGLIALLRRKSKFTL